MGEAGERAVPWCFQIIFNSAGQRNHYRSVSPVLHLKAKKINKRFSNRGYKKKSLPSRGRATATASGPSGADPGQEPLLQSLPAAEPGGDCRKQN